MIAKFTFAFATFLITAATCVAAQQADARADWAVAARLHEDRFAGAESRDQNQIRFEKKIIGRTPKLDEAWRMLQSANDHYRGNRLDDAIKTWDRIVQEQRDTDAALAALTNLGICYAREGNTGVACKKFRGLLDLERPKSRESLFDYANYRHNACFYLSLLHEQRDELDLALKYAMQSLDEDRYKDLCGFVATARVYAIQSRVTRLKRKKTNKAT